MTIKAVVFDIGGVLKHVQDDAWPDIWIRGWERRMNLPAGHVTAALESTGDMMTAEMSEAQIRDLYAVVLGLDEHRAHPSSTGSRKERLGVKAHEIVFLDDHDPHVQAARACGWHAVWHRDTAVSIQEITGTIEQAAQLPS